MGPFLYMEKTADELEWAQYVQRERPSMSLIGPISMCYVLVERSARLELGGYDSVVWHVAPEACASSTL